MVPCQHLVESSVPLTQRWSRGSSLTTDRGLLTRRLRDGSAAQSSLGSQRDVFVKLSQPLIEHFVCCAGHWVPELHGGWSTSPVPSARALVKAASLMSLLAFQRLIMKLLSATDKETEQDFKCLLLPSSAKPPGPAAGHGFR